MTTTPTRALLQRLGRFLDGFSACFSRRPQRAAASRYVDGLLNDSERKSMQAMHSRLSDPGQYQALQHFITDSPWDAQRVWAQLRAVVPVRAGILAIDGATRAGVSLVGRARRRPDWQALWSRPRARQTSNAEEAPESAWGDEVGPRASADTSPPQGV